MTPVDVCVLVDDPRPDLSPWCPGIARGERTTLQEGVEEYQEVCWEKVPCHEVGAMPKVGAMKSDHLILQQVSLLSCFISLYLIICIGPSQSLLIHASLHY